MKEKKVEYFKFIDNTNNTKEVLKLLKIKDYNGRLEYTLTVALKLENKKFKKVNTNTVLLSLITIYSNNMQSIEFNADFTKNLTDISSEEKELLLYVSSLILKDTKKHLTHPENHYIKFVNEDNIKNILLDTNLIDLNLDTEIPKTIEKYKYAIDLIQDTIDLIPFSNERVKPLDLYGQWNFMTEEIYEKNATFDISKIIGTDHPDYKNKTWFKMITNLKRSANIEQLLLDEEKDIASIKYYKNRKDIKFREDPWGIYVVNGDAYITEGNHRTVIAKFLQELDLIDKNIESLKYVKKIQIDFNESRKFHAIKKWLNKYYAKYDIKVNSRIIELDRQEKGNISTIKYKTNYEMSKGYRFEEIDGKMQSVEYLDTFNDLKTLKAYLRKETKQFRRELMFKILILDAYLKDRFNKYSNFIENKWKKSR